MISLAFAEKNLLKRGELHIAAGFFAASSFFLFELDYLCRVFLSLKQSKL